MGLMAALISACDDDDDDPDPAAPSISSINPDSGTEGTSVTISGSDFGDSPSVSFGGTNATVSSSTSSSITTAVPSGLSAGDVQVTVSANGQTSNAVTFTVEEDDPEPTPDVTTVADTVVAIDSLSILETALTEADGDLVTTLSGDGPFTVFAPVDGAFADLVAALGVADAAALISTLGTDVLSQVLLAHVVADSLPSDLIQAQDYPTANDSTITITTDADGNVFANGAQVIAADIITDNGVVHIIDSVINLPPVGGGEVSRDDLGDYLAQTGNEITDPMLGSIPTDAAAGSGALNPIPSGDAITSNLAAYPDDMFFDQVSYKGAFDPSATTTWLDGWSLLSRAGILSTGTDMNGGAAYDPADTAGIIVDLPQTIDIGGGTLALSADSIYRFDGYTFVENGTIQIPAGTLLLGRSSDPNDTTEEAATMIITTSARIEAEGTAEDPIIFTSELDDGSLLPSDFGQWGGLIVLGEAQAFVEGNDSGIQIEGIPTSETRATYGGMDDEDDSGILRYVSIRHTGDELSPGNEVQGLTLGGVGSGTTIEYVESIGSDDDGIEIFGGTVNIKYFAVAYQEDDAFDFDLGWRGNGQFLFALNLPGGGALESDHSGEWDGADPDEAPLASDFTIANATFIGPGDMSARDDTAPAILVRDNAAADLLNSIVTNWNGKAIEIEDRDDTDTGDSFAKFQNGEIDIEGNIFNVGSQYTEFGFGDNGILAETVQ